MITPLKKILIVGGGTAGWIAAAILSNQLNPEQCRIELIESDEIGTIGVGESTIPPFLELLQSLNIDEKDFVRKTQASFKLGIQFTDWRIKGESYFHPFGSICAGMNEYTFYQSWLKSLAMGDGFALQDFSPSCIMAKQGRFFFTPKSRKNTHSGSALRTASGCPASRKLLAPLCRGARGNTHRRKGHGSDEKSWRSH